MELSSQPLVSIIVPVYCRERTITRALESIKSQTYQNYEVIIMDDGSTDASASLIKPYTSDSRFLYFYQQNSGKPSIPRNNAIKHAKGHWLAFLDSDDEWTPDLLMNQMKTLDAYKGEGVKMVFCDNQKYENGSLAYSSFFKQMDIVESLDKCTKQQNSVGRLFDPLLLQRALCAKGFIMTQGVVISTALFKNIGMFDSRLTFAEDTDSWLTATQRSAVAQSFGQGFIYHCHGDNITSGKKDICFTDTIAVLEKHEKSVAGDRASLQRIRARILRYKLELRSHRKQVKSSNKAFSLDLKSFLNLRWDKVLVKTVIKQFIKRKRVTATQG